MASYEGSIYPGKRLFWMAEGWSAHQSEITVTRITERYGALMIWATADRFPEIGEVENDESHFRESVRPLDDEIQGFRLEVLHDGCWRVKGHWRGKPIVNVGVALLPHERDLSETLRDAVLKIRAEAFLRAEDARTQAASATVAPASR